jgi:hypothetical protein
MKLWLLLVVAVHLVRIKHVAAGVISEYVGGSDAGVQGTSPPGTTSTATVAATSAALSNPYAMVFDATGNMYLAVQNSQMVVVVKKATGFVFYYAGNGAAGSTGDGGAATSAKLYYPRGIAMDSSNNIFIADYNNFKVRMVTWSTNIITTFAGTGVQGSAGGTNGDGGAAINAQFVQPFGLAVDRSNNVYVSDYLGHNVRVIKRSTGIITTFAGTGTQGYSGDSSVASSTNVKLNNPCALAVDTSNNVYIADAGNSRVRVVAASTSIITTYAGTGNAGSNGDNLAATSAKINLAQGIALDTSNNLYIADYANQAIRFVSAASGIISTVAGSVANTMGSSGDGGAATSALLNYPSGVALDSSNNLFIADTENGRVRTVPYTTVATWTSSYSSSTTLSINTFAGTGATGSTGNGVAATTALFNGVQAVAVDTSSNVYVVDQKNSDIRKISVSTGIVSVVAGTVGSTTGSSGNGDGGLATSATLNQPYSVSVDSSGNMFISDTYSNRVRLVTTSGIITTFASSLNWPGQVRNMSIADFSMVLD